MSAVRVSSSPTNPPQRRGRGSLRVPLVDTDPNKMGDGSGLPWRVRAPLSSSWFCVL